MSRKSTSPPTVSQKKSQLLNAFLKKQEQYVKTGEIHDGEFKYHFTKDPDLLKQYYRLRGDMYALELNLENFSRGEDQHDKESDILVLEKNGQVVGGVRITMLPAGTERLLPMEGDEFILKTLIPELNLNDVVYGEFSRLAILPEYRNDHLATIIGIIGEKGRAYNASYLFAISPLTQGRMYRKYEKYFGFSLEVRDDLGQSQVAKKWGIHMPLLIFREGSRANGAKK